MERAIGVRANEEQVEVASRACRARRKHPGRAWRCSESDWVTLEAVRGAKRVVSEGGEIEVKVEIGLTAYSSIHLGLVEALARLAHLV